MSRIGKHPVVLPKGVTAKVEGNTVQVKGPKGELERTLHDDMKVSLSDNQIVVERPSDEANHKALHSPILLALRSQRTSGVSIDN